MHRPALVLLDEPTTGADVRTRAQILELVRGLADEGSAVVYSTHYLHEIETLDADVAFIDHGRIVARGTPAELVAAHGSSALELTFDGPVPAAARARAARSSTARRSASPPTTPAASRPRLLPALGADASSLRSIEIVRPSLESVYLAVTGRRYDDASDDANDDTRTTEPGVMSLRRLGVILATSSGSPCAIRCP